EDALPLFTEVFERRKNKLGPENQGTLKSMYALALAYKVMNQLEDSLSLFKELLALTEKREPLPKGYPQVSETKDRIAEILAVVKAKQQSIDTLIDRSGSCSCCSQPRLSSPRRKAHL